MTLSYKEVADILKIIDASDCEEVILELEGVKLVVRRGAGSTSTSETRIPVSSTKPPSNNAPQTNAKTRQTAQPASPAAPENPDEIVVRAPMVGTLYRRPAPDEAPFVEVGSQVKAGDPICLIEVMKLFTTVEASIDGTIASIAVKDAALVEFNQPLLTIKPA